MRHSATGHGLHRVDGDFYSWELFFQALQERKNAATPVTDAETGTILQLRVILAEPKRHRGTLPPKTADNQQLQTWNARHPQK